jgi:outer membrane protein assembly factor BamB
MKKYIVIILVLLPLLVSCDRSGKQADKSSVNRHIQGNGLADTWPAEGPGLLWVFEGLGKGYGSPCISADGIYVNAEEDGNSFTVCLDHQGTLLWKSPNGKEFTGVDFSASYPGTRSAPAVSGKHVYAASGMGHLSCFDKRSGKVVWTIDLINDLRGKLGDFGYSESPVLDKEKIYCFAGGREDNLVALDRQTGELVWTAQVKRDSFAYGTPILLNLSDRKVLVGTSRNYIHVVDRQDGTLLSSYQLEDIREGWEHCNSVVHRDGYIYFITCEEHGQGSIKLRLSEDDASLTEVWRNPKVVNVFEGFVLVDDLLYTTMENKKLVALDAESGRIRHSVRAVSGSIIHAEGKLIIYGHNGKLQLFSLENGKPEFRSEMRIRQGTGQHFSFPVIGNGVLYIRRGDALMAYSICLSS